MNVYIDRENEDTHSVPVIILPARTFLSIIEDYIFDLINLLVSLDEVGRVHKLSIIYIKVLIYYRFIGH